MSKITDFPGSLSPVWSFGPDKFYGPTEYQVVKIHNNVPPVLAVQAEDEPQAAGHVLGVGAALQAAAIDLRILRGRPREGGRPAGNRGTTRPPHVLTSLARRCRSGRLADRLQAQPLSSMRSSRLPDVVALRPRATDDAQAMLVGDGGRPCRMSWARVSIASFSSGWVRM